MDTIIQIVIVIFSFIAKVFFLIFMGIYIFITSLLGITPEDDANEWYDSFIEDSLDNDDSNNIYNSFSDYAKKLNPELMEQIEALCDFYKGSSTEIEEMNKSNIDVSSHYFYDNDKKKIFRGTCRYMKKHITTDKDNYIIIITSYVNTDDSKYDGIYNIEICKDCDANSLSDSFPAFNKNPSISDIGINIATHNKN